MTPRRLAQRALGSGYAVLIIHRERRANGPYYRRLIAGTKHDVELAHPDGVWLATEHMRGPLIQLARDIATESGGAIDHVYYQNGADMIREPIKENTDA